MAMKAAPAANGGVSKTLTATVYPSDARNKVVDWTLEWLDTEKQDTLSDYLTLTPASDGANTATLTCLQALEGEALVTVTTREGGYIDTCRVVFVGDPTSLTVSCDANELGVRNSYTLDDLKSATVNGQPFNLSAYPRNPFGAPQVITFAEYCYFQYENGNGNYALYIYVYNPTLTEFSLISQRNKIEISSDFFYAGEEGAVGSVKDYTKFPLKFCNASTGDYENRFLKFRIVDENNVLLNAEREHEEATGSRYYHIAGIELFAIGGDATTAQDYWMNQYYQFSGYAEGYGDSEKFPFQCDATGNAEAVQLDVQHTYYRTESSSNTLPLLKCFCRVWIHTGNRQGILRNVRTGTLPRSVRYRSCLKGYNRAYPCRKRRYRGLRAPLSRVAP